VVGLIAATLIATPVIALAASTPRPFAGTWTAKPEDAAISGSLVVASGRNEIKSMTFDVEGDAVPTGCPTGTLTIPGPLELKYYVLKGTRPFWAFGQVANVDINGSHLKRFQETRVSGATLGGKPDNNIELDIQFDNGSAQNDRIAGGILDLEANKIKPAYGASTCAGSVGELQPGSPTS
jgi:hypothetical protein